MYRDTGAGSEPKPPAFMCMVLLLQGYLQISDAEAGPQMAVDARWQMVLDCVGAEESPVSQATVQRFRERLVNANMDRRLLERTVELAHPPAKVWAALTTAEGVTTKGTSMMRTGVPSPVTRLVCAIAGPPNAATPSAAHRRLRPAFCTRNGSVNRSPG